eukprot:GHVN01082268.1.p1 GENE.GHVN01082268.1~~GHVN01082268.1.p1  ORF type:complete len:1155 (-),score=211.69 GHVN01082268.1:127-3591(-)
MAQSIYESTAKHLLLSHSNLTQPCVEFNADVDLDELPTTHPWLLTSRLVVKPDVLLKRRGKSGLVLLDVSWDVAAKHLAENIGKEIVVEGLSGVLSNFIIEPFFPHSEDSEMYIAMRTLREGDEILFSTKGGVNVGDVEAHARRLLIPVKNNDINEEFKIQIDFENLFDDVKDETCRHHLPCFTTSLYSAFTSLHFSFLEINPFAFNLTSSTSPPQSHSPPKPHSPGASPLFTILDVAAKLDHTAEFVCRSLWGSEVQFPSPFGRLPTKAEQHVRDLDAKTGASLKLTILNPKGRIWTMIAGGGASVLYSDTLCDLGHVSEVANYGEYSGAPSEVMTYEYAKTIIQAMTQEDSYRDEGKLLLIGGGIANFTSVADTFKGIIRALKEYQHTLLAFKVRVYVRRGGPNYQEGLKMMSQLGDTTGIPVKVYGPETYITDIIPIAIEDDKSGLYKSSPRDSPRKGDCTGGSSLSPRRNQNVGTSSPPDTVRWHETKMEDIENDPSFKATINKIIDNHRLNNAGVSPRSSGTHEKHTRVPHTLSTPLFNSDTQCFVWGLQVNAVQEMLDFDNVCGRRTPSVCAIVYEFSVSHLRPFYFGTEEIFIPVCQHIKDACARFPTVDFVVNFTSMRSAYKSTQSIIQSHTPPIRTIAVIAEGVPERQARMLMVAAKQKGVTLIGPATVGGIKPGCFRVGNTGGRLENIMNSKLYRPGSVGLVTKSGGMLNEVNNILSLTADGTCEGIAVGGDRFPGTTLHDHVLRFQHNDAIKMIVMLGEVGGMLEYEVADAVKEGLITKPVVAWCFGTCAEAFTTEVSFGHAGAWAGSRRETAKAKNAYMKEAGLLVPTSFQQFGLVIKSVFERLVASGVINRGKEPEAPRVPMDYAWAKKLGLVRRPKGFISTISDDRGEELVYAGWPISKVLQSDMGVGGVIALLWFKRPLPDYCYRYLESVLMLTADHGPAVCGAHNTIVTARAGKDLISSLISGLCTIGDRFGGACDQAAQQFLDAYRTGITPEDFVVSMKNKNQLIMGVGHKIKTVHNPDMRVQLLSSFCRTHFRHTSLIDYAFEVEKITTRKKDTLILNVDGLIGVSMCDMLLSSGAFTEEEAVDYIGCGCINGLFVLGRSVGFIGHYLDQKRLKQGLYRHDVDDISYVLPELKHEE